MVKQGGVLEETIPAIEEVQSRTFAYARLDTLEYLRRGGRLSYMKHTIASLMDMKPIMKMVRGLELLPAPQLLRQCRPVVGILLNGCFCRRLLDHIQSHYHVISAGTGIWCGIIGENPDKTKTGLSGVCRDNQPVHPLVPPSIP